MNSKENLISTKATVSLPVQPTVEVTTAAPESSKGPTTTKEAVKKVGGPASPVTVPGPNEKADKTKLKIPKKKKMKTDSQNSIPLSEHSTSDFLREYYASGKDPQKKLRPGLVTSSGIGDSSEAFASVVSSGEDDAGTESQGTQESLLNEKLPGSSVSEVGAKAKCCACWLRTRGIVLAVLSSIQLSLTAYCAFNLHKRRYYSVPVLSMTRFSGIFFFSSIIIPLFIHRHTQVISTVYPLNTCERRLSVLRMFLRAFVGSCSVVFQFYSLKHISPADSSVILHCNPVFVAFGARLFLKEKVTICASVTAILAIIGVIIISKPPFLIGEDEFDSDQLMGMGFAIGAMLTLTGSILLMRSLRELHFSMLNTVFGFTGLVTAISLGLATRDLLRTVEMEVYDFLILFAMALLSFGGIYCMTMALTYEQAGPVAVARSSEVIFSFLWQMISNIFPDALSIGGATLVMTCILLTGFYKYVAGLHPSHKLRRWFWFVLK